MEFRCTTDSNPEHNCEFFNRMKLRRLARESQSSVAKFVAVHGGIDQREGLRLDAAVFNGLPADLEVAEGALVLIILNLAVEHGLMNGTHGTVKKIVYTGRKSPLCEDPRDCLPDAVVVDCPKYAGPPFFDEPAYRTWVPLLPRCVPAEFDSAIARTNFPLTLGWALTPWKAQGMTLEKIVVDLGAKASSPGVAFVALTRVRHPDHMLLEDTFPAMSVIMKQKDAPAFMARQAWERDQAVLFSKTLRRCIRDPALYSEQSLWTTSDDALADVILALARSHDLSDVAALRCACASASGQDCSISDIERVVGRLQKWPHSLELQTAQQIGSLAPCVGKPAKRKEVRHASSEALITDGSWTCRRAALEDWLATGVLSLETWEFFARLFRETCPQKGFPPRAARRCSDGHGLLLQPCPCRKRPMSGHSARQDLSFLG